MNIQELDFSRPANLQATLPPEIRGQGRDDVRLLISTLRGHHHSKFVNLANFLEQGDILVVNRSATLAASLPAKGHFGDFILNLSTCYSERLWLAEPRWSFAKPGPLPLQPNEAITVAGSPTKLLAPYPNLPRLWFVSFEKDVSELMEQGTPIRYGYVPSAFELDNYQTIFADKPGSAEMPSAARPFSNRVLEMLKSKGVKFAFITLHTGVSSLELNTENIEEQTLYPEPFEVPLKTAEVINLARTQNQRIIAVGTTVVRALESAWNGKEVRASKGFTRLYLHPKQPTHVINGLLTGFHDPKASHLAMLYVIAGKELVMEGYQEAVAEGYLWHEFGDSHLLLP